MKNKFSFRHGETNVIANNDLACGNCAFAYKERVADCIMFNQKPLSVLKGGNCPKKQQKQKG